MESIGDIFEIRNDGITILNKHTKKVNKFNINNKGGLFRMTSANINMGFTFTSKNSKEKSKESDNSRSGGRTDDLFGRVDDFARI